MEQELVWTITVVLMASATEVLIWVASSVDRPLADYHPAIAVAYRLRPWLFGLATLILIGANTGRSERCLLVASQIISWGSGLPVALITAFGALTNVYRSRIRWDTTSGLLFAGVMGWIVGGIPAIVDATIPINGLMHNTLWVPGHFHTYLLGMMAILLGFATLARGFLAANFLSMVGTVGALYLAAPVRLCAYYRLDQQAAAGRGLIVLAGVAGFAWLFAALFGWPREI